MSTATISAPAGAALFQRFVWKEYRMLRGFWLAVGVLGVLMQWVMTQVMLRGTDQSSSMLLVAWGAAALYTVGAAVTLFSAESEERTRDFLLILPGRWLPMFAAKVTTAVVSAFCLGLLLCVAGEWVNDQVWASAAEFQNAFAIGGIAVFEAMAWGLLFSLWLRQPLLAAVLAIGAASFGVQVAIAATPTAHHVFTNDSFREAIPMRLLLSFAVFAVDVWLGARWYEAASCRGRVFFGWARGLVVVGAKPRAGMCAKPQAGRRRVMVRLFWQTWRESWKTMLVSIPIAFFLMVALALPLRVLHSSASYADLPSPMLTLLFLPALFGALVFRADQRGDHRQFLVAHAARPRYVWLARHLFWGTGLLAIAIAVSMAFWLMATLGMKDSIQRIFNGGYGGYFPNGAYLHRPLNEPWRVVSIINQTVLLAMRFTWMIWTSLFTAYALGQFCSLMLRREILAGLIALLLSIVLVAWAAVTGFWQLSAWWFVMPIGIGAMLATWLRMPDWVVARNRPKTWALPIAVVVMPFVLIFATLPSARLAQLQEEPGHPQFVEQVRKFEARRAAGKATADAYFRVYVSLEEAERNADSQAVVEQLIDLTKRPECRFSEINGWHTRKQVDKLHEVLQSDAHRLQQTGELEAALERHLSRMRLNNHRLSGQPTFNIVSALHNHYIESEDFLHDADGAFLQWAQHPDQTSELLRKAVVELERFSTTAFDPREAILADRERIRDVLLGDELPSFLNDKNPRGSGYLAYLANQFPWERQRALQALDIRTSQILEYVVAGYGDEYEYSAATRRQLIGCWHDNRAPMPQQSIYGTDWNRYSRATQNAFQASTSYLVTREMNRRMNVRDFLLPTMNVKARRVGLIIQLALLAYRLDHQRYPETLAELMPEYLRWLLSGPYSDPTFGYRPLGFDLPLMKQGVLMRHRDNGRISEHTPLFWSVGLSNCQPREGLLTITSDDDRDYQPEEEETIEVITLQPTETGNFWQAPLVFVLPKIEPTDVSPEDDQPEEKGADEVQE